MTPSQIRDEIIDILANILPDDDFSGLDDQQSFRHQLGLDSMDFLDIVMELRKRFRIQVPEDDYIQLASMESAVCYLEPLMKCQQTS
jgi:acyl carrier protein